MNIEANSCTPSPVIPTTPEHQAPSLINYTTPATSVSHHPEPQPPTTLPGTAPSRQPSLLIPISRPSFPGQVHDTLVPWPPDEAARRCEGGF
ncbi:hypothetical protein E2C01_009156 [Portunus trituberculatus]|uniref:Uncharacterized protein n=1 Tax=Portunus trituberculatus TaxID=210409 RepID=A0A5B7D5A5_PORTR|nr:hypothetical protein [Portunus trituberculatus]